MCWYQELCVCVRVDFWRTTRRGVSRPKTPVDTSSSPRLRFLSTRQCFRRGRLRVSSREPAGRTATLPSLRLAAKLTPNSWYFSHWWVCYDYVSQQGRAASSIRPFVSTLSFELTDLWTSWIIIWACLGLKVIREGLSIDWWLNSTFLLLSCYQLHTSITACSWAMAVAESSACGSYNTVVQSV